MKSIELQPNKENLLRTFELDAIERNVDIYRFINLLNAIEDNCSVALDGAWGSGKTFFVKQTKMILDAYNEFIGSHDDIENNTIRTHFEAMQTGMRRVPIDVQPEVSVYYDAWSNDNDIDPMLSLVYEILQTVNTDYSFKKSADCLKIAAAIADFFTGKKVTTLVEAFTQTDRLAALKEQKSIHTLIHDYFFAKTLDKVRPGGIVAFVTSSGTMDKKNPAVRKYIAQRADLLGAIRLPNNAFLANAGTGVVADILFLQKRDRPIEVEPDWVHLGRTESGYTIKKFCSRIATGDYDAVIIGHSQFEKIPMSVERQRAILQAQLDEIIDGISEAKRANAERFTIKQMEKSKRSIKLKLDKLNDQTRKDDVVTFEELGVDRLFVDEAHSFKNLFLYTKMRNVAGLAQTEAQKSSDLFMKCRYMDELTDNHGIVFATGTPISNSMTEMYTMQRYLQYDTLRSQGLQHFDAWASTFGETITAIELAPEGTGYRAKTRFARFYNLPELISMFNQVADVQTADMLKLPVPEAEYHNEVIKPSKFQTDIISSTALRM